MTQRVAMRKTSAASCRVAVVNREFPSLTRTFHCNEFLALVSAPGVEVEAYALKRPSICSPEAEPLAKLTHYLPPFFSWSAFVSILRVAARHPLRALSSLCGILARARPGNKEGGIPGGLVFALRGLQLADLLAPRRPDVIYAQFATEAATIGVVAAHALDIPLVIAVHSPYTLYRHSALLRYKVKHARLVTAISREARDRLAALGAERIREGIHVVRCGVDSGRLGHIEPRPADPPTILSVGSLIELKGHRHLIEACSLLRDRGRVFRCEIIGDGPLRSALERLADQRDLHERVAFRGALGHEEVIDAYARAMVFVLASCVAGDGDMDGIPVVLMEAMAAGVPCVSTRVSGIPELISTEEEGLLVEETQPAALADAMERLLSDRALRAKIVPGARAKVAREFEPTRSCAHLTRLLRTGLTTSSGGQV